MKKRFLPFLMAVLVLGQFAIADNGGHYVPRTQPTMNAESFMGSLRANQNTGLIDPADMFKAMQAPAMKNAANDPLYWISMGPDNMGGQTTAVLYDNQSNVVYIGSKGGGVYKTYNNGITWHKVGDQNLLVSCMVQDKDGVIYVGTGDGGDNVNQNGLSQYGYSNSFIGTGIWTINVNNGDAFEQVVTPTADEWLYVNDLAFAGNKLLAATSEGLKYSEDKGATWALARAINADGEAEELTGNAVQVKVGVDNLVVASVEGMVYIGRDLNSMECHSGSGNQIQGDTLLPTAAGLFDIAVSPTTEGVIYAASIHSDGTHKGVYRSDNYGATWTVVLPSVGSGVGHSIYEGYGLYNHGLVVDPQNDGVVYVTSHVLWRLQQPSTGTGYYLSEALTSNTTISSPAYLHVGLHTMVFNPKNANEFYIGTNGGIFKGTRDFTFTNCNRNYVTSRMFNVAYSGKDTRVLAAGLDHGTVLIEGDEDSNTLGTGLWINPTGDNQGAFSDDSHAGSCAISCVNPNTFIVTYNAAGLKRTETAGGDWVSTNFTELLANDFALDDDLFYTPILLQENYNDPTSKDSVWFKNETGANIHFGIAVPCMSNNNYPFEYTLNDTLRAGDSIQVVDPVTARMLVATKNAVYLTFMSLQFSEATVWYKLFTKKTGFSGIPISMAMTPDGDDVFVGTKAGRLYHWAGLNSAADTVWTKGSGSSQKIYHGKLVAPTYEDLGQCVTSIAIDPRNPNKMVVTLGNYGNDDYVLYSTNALSDAPEFTSVQGNLPKMPVYSSLIEMETGDVILGTERGIFRTKDITSGEWGADSHMLGEVPVMELKQQLLCQEDKETSEETPDGVFITEYPGVHNTGVIYAATYGRGVFRCENYKKEFTSVPEIPAMAESFTVTMYPNPVQSEATVSFNVTGNTDVNFQVFDLMGRMVMNQNMGRFTEGQQEFRINTENLSTGSYILRLNQGGTSSCVKFMVY